MQTKEYYPSFSLSTFRCFGISAFQCFGVCAMIAMIGMTTGYAPHAAAQDADAESVFIDEVALADALQLDWFDLQPLDLPQDRPARFEAKFTFVEEEFTLSLERFSIRTDGFLLLVEDETGEMKEVKPPPPHTYRGTLLEIDGSEVAASLVDGQLSAVILLPDGSLWSIQPVSEVALGTPPSWHVVYDFTDVRPGLGICGNDDLMEVNAVQTDSSAPGEEGEDESTPPEGGPGAQVGERVADIAFDADVEFFRLNGSSVNLTLFDIERVANAVNVIYRRDVRIDHWISAIIVRTREQDPYNQTNSSALLCQFRTWWNANHRGISRDTAHLMTGKNLDGNIIGVAWTGVICNVEGRGRLCNVDANLAYGLSQSTSSNFARRVALTAHEVGHNWNAGHCDGDNDCNIMCATIGGCSGNLTSFGTRSRNSIAAHRNSRDCLFTCKAVANVPGDSNRVIGGAHAVCWGGRVAISAGSYPEVWHLNKKVTLTSKGGLVRIGK